MIDSLNLVWSTTDIGGSERRTIDAIPVFIRRGIAVKSFIPSRVETPLEAGLAAAGSSIVRVANPIALGWKVGRASADVTWTFGLRRSLPVRVRRLIRLGWRAGHLWSAQNGLESTRGAFGAWLSRVTASSLDLVVANSSAAARFATDQGNVAAERVKVVPSALSPEWSVRPQRSAKSRVSIAMIGNARPEKQHALGLRVFEQLDDSDTDFHIFTNQASGISALLDRADASLTDRVTIHSGVRVTPETFHEIDVLLHPSSSESLPRAVLEARSQGAWVVGFDVGDMARYTNERVTVMDARGLLESLSRAVASVRTGCYPSNLIVNSVEDYVDQLAALN